MLTVKITMEENYDRMKLRGFGGELYSMWMAETKTRVSYSDDFSISQNTV